MAGAGILYRSILRRDWLRILLWAAGLVGLQIYAVAAFNSIYGSDADLIGYANVVETSPASRAFSGPGYGLDPPTLGAVITNDMLAFLAAGVALMSVFLIARNTRAEEEDGRAELVAAAGVGAHARSVAALGVLVTINLGLGVIFALIMVIGGLEAAGAIAFGAACAGCGLAFTGLALVAAQLSSHARVGTAIAGGMLGVAYLVRAIGDMAENGVSWLSPIGWAQAIRPFADERVLPLALLIASAAALIWVALALERRRDLGGGFIDSRPGPARGRPYMARFGGLALRMSRVAIASWLAGTIVLGVTYGTVANEVEEMIADSPEIADFLAGTDGSALDAYFVTILLVLALVATGFAIQCLLRMRAEETSGRAEALLSTGLSRGRWALGYAAVMAGGVVAILLSGGFTMGLGYALVGGGGGSIISLTLSALAWLPAVLAAVGLVAALIGLLPRFALAAWGLLAYFFFVGFFGDALDLPGWIKALSPFDHVPEVPAADFSVGPILALLAIAIALGAASLQAFRRRDIG